ncbi:sugar ABC transporter substrate-binding protein [Paenibacillus eucommiae]|uniref:Inositol transport system substrate-binding protein n=1 Tax=Paenibacillus eucommiae TaxID=1355755 RepID=A0ABS4JBH6_9BACL|nr:sugar ABC transporter substrate-binding protein [Paenibacillus eucommiae]MBP1996089.1 inositol transport system substrate-binding protein [Paenibacillus eucommiae]
MKKLLLILVGCTLIIALAACGSKTETGADGEKQKVIGVTMNNLSTEFTATLAKGIEEAAKAKNVKVIVNDGEGNPNKQIQQVETFIAQKVDAIIIQPLETEASSPAIEKAKKAGIPILNVNSITTAEPDAFVGSRDEESAELAIDYIAKMTGDKGNIVMMHGRPGQSAEIKRTTGAMDQLKKYPDMKLIAEQTAEWDRNKALNLMQNWLQAHKGQISAVFAQNDEMGMGALKAIEDAGLKKDIIVVSVDAISDALQSVKDGKLDATVFQNAKGQGAGAIDTALKIIAKESVEKEVFIPFELVTKENVDQYVTK